MPKQRNIKTFIENWNAVQALLVKENEKNKTFKIPTKNFDALQAFNFVSAAYTNQGDADRFDKLFKYICDNSPQNIFNAWANNSEQLPNNTEILKLITNIINYKRDQLIDRQYAIEDPVALGSGRYIGSILQHPMGHNVFNINDACVVQTNNKSLLISLNNRKQYSVLNLENASRTNHNTKQMAVNEVNHWIAKNSNAYNKPVTATVISSDHHLPLNELKKYEPNIDPILRDKTATRDEVLLAMKKINSLEAKMDFIERKFEEISKPKKSPHSALKLFFFYNTKLDDEQRRQLTLLKQAYYKLIVDAVYGDYKDKTAIIQRVNQPGNLIDYSLRFKGETDTRKLFISMVSHAERKGLVESGVMFRKPKTN